MNMKHDKGTTVLLHLEKMKDLTISSFQHVLIWISILINSRYYEDNFFPRTLKQNVSIIFNLLRNWFQKIYTYKNFHHFLLTCKIIYLPLLFIIHQQ